MNGSLLIFFKMFSIQSDPLFSEIIFLYISQISTQQQFAHVNPTGTMLVFTDLDEHLWKGIGLTVRKLPIVITFFYLA